MQNNPKKKNTKVFEKYEPDEEITGNSQSESLRKSFFGDKTINSTGSAVLFINNAVSVFIYAL